MRGLATRPVQGRPQPRRAREPNARPAVVAFHGAKGGVGTTTLAVESAVAVARAGANVALVDLDLYGGDAHYRLDVAVPPGAHTVAGLLPVIEELDGRIIGSAFSRCPCGVSLLPSPAGLPEAALFAPEHVRTVVSAARAAFDLVVLDTSSGAGDVTLEALECCDLAVIVVSPEISCLGATLKILDRLGPGGPAGRPRALIINRSLGRSDLVTTREVEGFLGLSASAVIPEAAAAFRRAADEGQTIGSDRSGPGRIIRETAARLFAASFP